MLNWRYYVIVTLFLASALFHAFALQWPGISVSETPETHLGFVFVNLWFAAEAEVLARRFFIGLGLLMLHQFVVHGYLLITAILAHRPADFDFQSAGVLLGLTIVATLSIEAARSRS